MLHPVTSISIQQALKFICYAKTNLTRLKSDIDHHLNLDSCEFSLGHLCLYRRLYRCHRTHSSKSRIEADIRCTCCCIIPIDTFECHITLNSVGKSQKGSLRTSYCQHSTTMNNRAKANRFHLHCSWITWESFYKIWVFQCIWDPL